MTTPDARQSREPREPRIPAAAPLDEATAERLDAKQRMVVTTAKLLQRQGYHATGLQQVVTEARAPRGSIYHHFPGGKEELAVQAVGVAAAELTRAIERAAERCDRAAELVSGLGAALARWLTGSAFHEGCPVSTVVLETAPSSPQLSAACAAAYDQWIGLLQDRLVADGLGDDEARALATTVLAGIEGGLLLARAHGATAPLETVVAQLAALVDERTG